MKAITLRILCEGLTESNFVTAVLKPHLAGRRVYARPEPLRRGQYGVVAYESLRAAIKADLGRSRAHEYLSTMIDLYKLGRYPENVARPGETVEERVQRIEAAMAEGLPNERFIPYIQVHEFEALILSDVSKIPAEFPDGEAADAPARLTADIAGAEPETIDEGETTAPSKRIIRCVPAYAAVKAVAGPAIAQAIGLETLRKECPHFNRWVSRLEQLSAED